MRSLRIQEMGDTAIIHCTGRIAFPHARELRIALRRVLRTPTVVLNLADTIAIDAYGLGVLVSIRTRVKQAGRVLKLVNLTPWVERLLQLTKLESEFEICTAREMLDLLCRALHQPESVPSETAIEPADVSLPASDLGSNAVA